MMSDLVVSAPGKVIVCGEHAVVYAKTAIAASVDLRTYLHLRPREDQKIVIDLPDIGLHGEWEKDFLDSLATSLPEIQNPPELKSSVSQDLREGLNKAAEFEGNSKGLAKIAFIYLYMALDLKKNQQGLEVFVTSHLPIGAGLGSSAAFSSSLATALLLWHSHFKEKDLDDLTIREDFTNLVNSWAFRAEKLIHGNPSGIDNCVATFGGAIAYVGGKMENLKRFPPLNFLLTNTRVPRNTYDLVSGVRLRKEKFSIVMDPLLDSIHGISQTFSSIFEELAKLESDELSAGSDVIQTIEDLIQINHSLLNAIGVGHPALDEVCKITKEFGFFSKLTGAGGGGCALTFIRPGAPTETVTKLIERLEGAGFQCFQTSIGVGGVSLHQPFGTTVGLKELNVEKISKQPIKFHLNSKKRELRE